MLQLYLKYGPSKNQGWTIVRSPIDAWPGPGANFSISCTVLRGYWPQSTVMSRRGPNLILHRNVDRHLDGVCTTLCVDLSFRSAAAARPGMQS